MARELGDVKRRGAPPARRAHSAKTGEEPRGAARGRRGLAVALRASLVGAFSGTHRRVRRVKTRILDNRVRNALDQSVAYGSSAGGPVSGYIWQLRRALAHLLRLQEGEAVTLERQDDICIVRLSGELLTAIQAKHSLRKANLTLSAPELWKTLRIWARLVSEGRNVPLAFVLATTNELDEGLSELAGAVKTTVGVSQLVAALDRVAAGKKNAGLAASYAAWSALTQQQKEALLTKVRVLAGQAKLAQATPDLRNAIKRQFIPEDQVERVTREVEGWFIETVSARLGTEGCQISSDEVWEFLQDRHLEYRAAAPPVEPTDKEEERAALAEKSRTNNATFLRQLSFLRASEQQLDEAAKFFARARVARNHWLDQAAVAVLQVSAYAQDLHDYWTASSHAAFRGLPADDEEAREGAGWRLHDTCMTYQAPFGAHVAPRYLTIGSYHLLADGPVLGWHPDYLEKLKAGIDG